MDKDWGGKEHYDSGTKRERKIEKTRLSGKSKRKMKGDKEQTGSRDAGATKQRLKRKTTKRQSKQDSKSPEDE